MFVEVTKRLTHHENGVHAYADVIKDWIGGFEVIFLRNRKKLSGGFGYYFMKKQLENLELYARASLIVLFRLCCDMRIVFKTRWLFKSFIFFIDFVADDYRRNKS